MQGMLRLARDHHNRRNQPAVRSGPLSRRGEEGVILLLVMWILVLISVVVLSWAQEWRTEIRLTANYRDAQECHRLAEAGVFYALGKLTETKIAETTRASVGLVELPQPVSGWPLDQTSRVIELPGGKVEVRVGDEGGKINLNMANEQTLTNIFTALRLPPDRVKAMVTNILDWRKQEGGPAGSSPVSPFAARKARLGGGLRQPFSRKTRFDTVEELAWVKGFESSPLIPRLADWFTVQPTGAGVNVNTASLEVLEALGFAPEQARTIIFSRQSVPYRQINELPPRAVDPRITQFQQPFSFQSSPFCTIKASGMVNNKKARHTIKAMARLDISAETPWSILSWVDDFPG